MITVLGAGLAGLSAAAHLGELGKKHILLEKERKVGGLCKSIHKKGYIFDCAPHIFYTKNEYVKRLIENLLKDNLIKHYRRAYIYMKGVYVKYPFEVNMHGLPKDIINDCIEGVKKRKSIKNRERVKNKGKNRENGKTTPRNFREWIYSKFGSGIAKHYMIPYNEKVWKYDLSKVNVDWIAGRVPSPNLQDMIRGSKENINKNFGPNLEFFYPRIGGIGAVPQAMAQKTTNLSLDSEVIGIKTRENEVEITYTKDGTPKKIFSKTAISSIPLPSLIEIMEEVPKEIRKAADDLVYNSIVCINIGVDRPDVSDKHWIYFPENEFLFNRISFPMNFSEHTVPKGRSSILVEITYRGKEIDSEKMENIKQKVRESLMRAELLKDKDQLDVFDVYEFKYAYVIYDFNHKNNISKIHNFLKQRNIIPIGRFGEWEYLNMDKAIMSGKNAATEIK